MTERKTPVRKTEMSGRPRRKAARRTAETGLAAHNLWATLRNLGNRIRNVVTLPDQSNGPDPIIAQPTLPQA